MFSCSMLFLNDLAKTTQNDLCLLLNIKMGKHSLELKKSNRKDSLYAYVVETDPFMVQFFEPNTSRSDAYRLNDVKFEVLPGDFVRIVKDPQLVVVGRSRVNYVF